MGVSCGLTTSLLPFLHSNSHIDGTSISSFGNVLSKLSCQAELPWVGTYLWIPQHKSEFGISSTMQCCKRIIGIQDKGCLYTYLCAALHLDLKLHHCTIIMHTHTTPTSLIIASSTPVLHSSLHWGSRQIPSSCEETERPCPFIPFIFSILSFFQVS